MLDPTSACATPSIRRAALPDYDALSGVYAELDQQHAAALPEIFRWTDQPLRSRERIAELLGRDDTTILVAEVLDEIVGLVQVVTRQTPETLIHQPRSVAVIAHLVVRAHYRRQGIGRALIGAAEGWARERGFAQIELGVWEFNRSAISFYEQQGYTTLSRLMSKSLGSDGESPRED